MKKLLLPILTLCISINALVFVFASQIDKAPLTYTGIEIKKLEPFDYSNFNFTDKQLTVSKSVYYLALGDSISTGFGLENYDSTKSNVSSFSNRLAKNLTKKTYVNLATDFLDTNDFLKDLRLLKSENYIDPIHKKVINHSGIITLTLGLDTIVNPITEAINNTTDQNLETVLKSETKRSNLIYTINKNVKAFIGTKSKNYKDGDFMQIISTLKELNPNADIIVQTIYNPYKDIKLLKELETIIQKMNIAIKLNESDNTYKIVDTYTIFNESNIALTNISQNFNPYPNALGHQLIYFEHLKALGID